MRRADETAEYKGSSDCTQPSSATDLNEEENNENQDSVKFEEMGEVMR